MALTAREHEMIDLVDRGVPDGEIASRRGMKESTLRESMRRLSCNPADDIARDNSIRLSSKMLGYATEAAGGWR